jgi:hypothetical protein
MEGGFHDWLARVSTARGKANNGLASRSPKKPLQILYRRLRVWAQRGGAAIGLFPVVLSAVEQTERKSSQLANILGDCRADEKTISGPFGCLYLRKSA